jgi:hypothetical protein
LVEAKDLQAIANDIGVGALRHDKRGICLLKLILTSKALILQRKMLFSLIDAVLELDWLVLGVWRVCAAACCGLHYRSLKSKLRKRHGRRAKIFD